MKIDEVSIDTLEYTPDNTIINSCEHKIDMDLLGQRIGELLLTLQSGERTIIEEYYGLRTGHPKTFKEIGLLLGKTGSRVSQKHARALRRLRHPSRGNKIKTWLKQ